MVLMLWRDDIPFMIIFSTRLLAKEIILTCLLLVTFLNISNMGITHFIVLGFIVIHRYWVFYKMKIRGTWVKQVYWCHVSNSMCSLHVSVLQLGNSCNISNFFIIIILVMVICDLWCYYCKNITTHRKLKWWLAFFTNNIFKLKHTHLKKIVIWLCQVLVVAHRIFRCSIQTFSWGMWDQLHDQRSNLGPLYWEHRVLATGPAGKSLSTFLKT